jgi:hypothetical protein
LLPFLRRSICEACFGISAEILQPHQATDTIFLVLDDHIKVSFDDCCNDEPCFFRILQLEVQTGNLRAVGEIELQSLQNPVIGIEMLADKRKLCHFRVVQRLVQGAAWCGEEIEVVRVK